MNNKIKYNELYCHNENSYCPYHQLSGYCSKFNENKRYMSRHGWKRTESCRRETKDIK